MYLICVNIFYAFHVSKPKLINNKIFTHLLLIFVFIKANLIICIFMVAFIVTSN